MKTRIKLISVLLISTQILAASPLTVFAEDSADRNGSKVVLVDQASKKDQSNDDDQDEITEEKNKEEEANKPVEPEQPNESEKPEPEQPHEPEQPEQPEQPKEPEQPEKPEQPQKPEQPEQAQKPDESTEVNQNEQSEPKSQPDEEIQSETTAPPATSINEQPSAAVGPQIESGSIHFEKNETAETFVKKIGEHAREVAQDNDLYASVMIAQAMLESGNGSSQLAAAPYYNLFGIKGKLNGKSVSFATQEDTGGGNMTTIQAAFRAYDSYEDSLKDYARLLKEGITGNSEFYSGTWKANTESYKDATAFLTGKYATDTKYNQKLNGLIETYELTEYDKEAADLELSATGFVVPLANYTISSSFGLRGGEFHRGLDFAAAEREPIRAAKNGTVITAAYHSSWGNYVVIEHNGGVTTLYAHQSEYIVASGDKVEQGQIIGYVGSTGNSTGSHLHLEVSSDSSLSQHKLINPANVLFN